MVIHGDPWVLMSYHGRPCEPMGHHGSPWEPMGSHGKQIIIIFMLLLKFAVQTTLSSKIAVHLLFWHNFSLENASHWWFMNAINIKCIKTSKKASNIYIWSFFILFSINLLLKTLFHKKLWCVYYFFMIFQPSKCFLMMLY